jgi:membrane associated rhomboid family serine protease
MLEDRDYMRQPEFGGPRWRLPFRLRWSWAGALVAVNVVVFILECLLCGYPPAFSQNNYFALSVDGIKHGFVWQLVTFQFMHAGLLHILLNSWTIFVFGRVLEEQLGPRRFLTLYFACGVVGGIFQVLGGMLSPAYFGTAVVGASAGAMGLLAAFATLYPDQPLTFLFFFIPVTARARYFVWGFAIFSAASILLPSISTAVLGANVANAAHLGGMAMGWFYVKVILNRVLLGVEEDRYSQPEPTRPAQTASDDFQDGDVDAVLDKISARGINSLTARERAILEAARKKMAQR